ncbi:hypothetical protein [Colwellia psychrerythraea]|uniref:Uncharacterized protein n=1 Tax=Colwellia psychrerythraea TaxID=28229 RepID=A0A099KYH8_COLPS|nr:hypothetical protein [Colwellia psychrerythraea]KGJ94698.1 hypothetical protein ND2E_1887 [Colwellia psychrerythraea]
MDCQVQYLLLPPKGEFVLVAASPDDNYIFASWLEGYTSKAYSFFNTKGYVFNCSENIKKKA